MRRGCADVALFTVTVSSLPPGLRQDSELADNLRQFAIASAVEAKGDLALARLLHLADMAVVGAELRAVFLGSLEREDHIFRRHRLAIVPFRLRTQPVGGGGEVVRMAHGFGEKPVFGRNFVERGHHQRVVDNLDVGGERAFDTGHDGIEVIEGAERDLPRHAAFRRRGVDVVEPLEAGRIFQRVVKRQPVPPCRTRRFFLRHGAARSQRGRQRTSRECGKRRFQQGPTVHA